MDINITAEWTDLVNAVGVIVALCLSAYQFWRQIEADREADERHTREKEVEAQRFAAQQEDRRRERLVISYPAWVLGMFDYVRQYTNLRAAVAEADDALERLRPEPRLLAEVFPELRDRATRQTEVALAAMGKATSAAMALRIDEDHETAARISSIMEDLGKLKQGSHDEGLAIANRAEALAEERVLRLGSR